MKRFACYIFASVAVTDPSFSNWQESEFGVNLQKRLFLHILYVFKVGNSIVIINFLNDLFGR